MAPRKSAPPTKNAEPSSADTPAKAPRARADWQAIERDYRTGKFSDQELADKHGNVVSRQAISKRAKLQGWKKDLTAEIRQATKASVIKAQVAERVAAQVAEGCQSATEATTDAVLAAAELNKQVILGHRAELRSARNLATTMLEELSDAGLLQEHRDLLAEILAGEGATASDLVQARQTVQRALNIGNRVQALKQLSDAFAKLQASERIAFGLDEKDDDKDKDSVSQALADFFSGIHGARVARLPFAEARKA